MNETFNIKELSTYLRCSISIIRKLVKENDIPFFRIGSKLFFKKTSIDNWINYKENNNLNDNNIKINPISKGGD